MVFFIFDTILNYSASIYNGLAVVGSGLSGAAAAIAATRGGIRVLIVGEDECLGGAACNSLAN